MIETIQINEIEGIDTTKVLEAIRLFKETIESLLNVIIEIISCITKTFADVLNLLNQIKMNYIQFKKRKLLNTQFKKTRKRK